MNRPLILTIEARERQEGEWAGEELHRQGKKARDAGLGFDSRERALLTLR
jgi:hypothetical protein